MVLPPRKYPLSSSALTARFTAHTSFRSLFQTAPLTVTSSHDRDRSTYTESRRSIRLGFAAGAGLSVRSSTGIVERKPGSQAKPDSGERLPGFEDEDALKRFVDLKQFGYECRRLTLERSEREGPAAELEPIRIKQCQRGICRLVRPGHCESGIQDDAALDGKGELGPVFRGRHARLHAVGEAKDCHPP